jgi:hypothetical protein
MDCHEVDVAAGTGVVVMEVVATEIPPDGVVVCAGREDDPGVPDATTLPDDAVLPDGTVFGREYHATKPMTTIATTTTITATSFFFEEGFIA